MNHLNMGLIALSLLPGILILISGIYLKFNASAYPNTGMGYKTELTVKNEQTWKEGNSFAGNVFILVGICNMILWPVAGYIFLNMTSLIVMSYLFFVLLSTIFMITPIENHLNRIFDRSGNHRTA